jgi:hypothetical protein
MNRKQLPRLSVTTDLPAWLSPTTSAMCAKDNTMSDPVSINIDRKTVEAVLQAQVQAAVATSIGQNPEFIAGIVQAMCNGQVDDSGKPCSYGEPLMAYVSRRVVQDAVRLAVQEWAIEQKPAIANALRKHLEKNKGNIIKRFCDAAEKAIDVNMGVHINFKGQA